MPPAQLGESSFTIYRFHPVINVISLTSLHLPSLLSLIISIIINRPRVGGAGLLTAMSVIHEVC